MDAPEGIAVDADVRVGGFLAHGVEGPLCAVGGVGIPSIARWVWGGLTRWSDLTPNRLTISCTVSIPNAPAGDSAAWFDIVDLSPATYRLYVFPGDADPPAQDSIDIAVEESVPGAQTSVSVLDQSGSHNVGIAGAAVV